MISRILDAWRDVAEIRAASRVEAAQIKAEAMLEIAQMSMPPVEEEPEPEEQDRRVAAIEEWAVERFEHEAQMMDAIGMAEVLYGVTKASAATRDHYRGRLEALGAPL